MALYLTLAVAAVLAARLVVRYDLYDREPWPVLAGVIAAGGLAMAAAGPLEDALIRWVGGGRPTAALIAVIAAAVEEGLRFVIVLGLALATPRYFNDPMDGLIYGSAAGIGMALEETAMYMAAAPTGQLAGALPVESVRLFGHVVMGGVTGFGIGLIHCRRAGRVWARLAAGCLGIGVFMHFVWDYVAISSVLREGWAATAATLSIALVVVSTALYGVLVIAGSKLSREVFAPGSPARVWRSGGGPHEPA